MSAPTGVVLLSGALVSSPTLWLLQQGSISADEALVRVLVCLVASWGAISGVAALAFTPAPRPAAQKAEDAAPVEVPDETAVLPGVR